MAIKVKAISIPKGYGLPKGKKYEGSAEDMKEDKKGMSMMKKKKKK